MSRECGEGHGRHRAHTRPDRVRGPSGTASPRADGTPAPAARAARTAAAAPRMRATVTCGRNAPPLGLMARLAHQRVEHRRLDAREAAGRVGQRHRQDVRPPRRQPQRPVDAQRAAPRAPARSAPASAAAAGPGSGPLAQEHQRGVQRRLAHEPQALVAPDRRRRPGGERRRARRPAGRARRRAARLSRARPAAAGGRGASPPSSSGRARRTRPPGSVAERVSDPSGPATREADEARPASPACRRRGRRCR